MRAGSALSFGEPWNEVVSSTSPAAARGANADVTSSTTASRSVGSSVRLSAPAGSSLRREHRDVFEGSHAGSLPG
jgi:hypothetical protein